MSSCGKSKAVRLKVGLVNWILVGESIPKKPPGASSNPNPLVGELNAEAVIGVNFSNGVEVTFLLKFEFEISARMFADRERSRRGLFADLFSGEPLPGTQSRFVSAKISNSVLNSWRL